MCFFDESGFKLKDCQRNYGWGNQRRIYCYRQISRQRKNSFSLLALMGIQGFLATHIKSGNTNGMDVVEFFALKVIPLLPEKSIIIMDNTPFHKGATQELLEIILASKNCLLFFLPPYCPDLNPIEYAFGTTKYYLKNVPSLFEIDPFQAIMFSLNQITPNNIIEWYKYCRYL